MYVKRMHIQTQRSKSRVRVTCDVSTSVPILVYSLILMYWHTVQETVAVMCRRLSLDVDSVEGTDRTPHGEIRELKFAALDSKRIDDVQFSVSHRHQIHWNLYEEEGLGVQMRLRLRISRRAGRGKVGTTSGLSLGMATLTESATVSGLVAPNPSSLTNVGAGISAVNSVSGRDSGSGLSAELRLSRTCDRRTTELVVSAWLASTERVTTGVGTSWRGAGTKSHSLTGRLRPTLCSEFSIIYFRSQNGDINRILSKTAFLRFMVHFDYPAHSLQETVLPQTNGTMESRDSEGVSFASLESLWPGKQI